MRMPFTVLVNVVSDLLGETEMLYIDVIWLVRRWRQILGGPIQCLCFVQDYLNYLAVYRNLIIFRIENIS